MNSFYKYFAVIIFPLLLSCDSKLEVDPKNEIVGADLLNSEENLKILLTGIYYEIGSFKNQGGGSQIISDLLGSENELKWNGTQMDALNIFDKKINSDNEMVKNHWSSCYSVINQCNLILDNLHIIENSNDEKNRREGEALFLRAFMYFDLIKSYAQPYQANSTNSNLGVPLRLTGRIDFSDNNFNLKRHSVEEVYSQILLDLISAENLLSDQNTGFADKYAVKFLKARVYLQMGNYEKALIESNDVIKESGHNLTTSYKDCFNNKSPSPEHIFFVHPTPSSSGITNFLNYFYSSSENGGTASISVDSNYLQLWGNQTEDQRYLFHSESNNLLLTNKYNETFAILGLFRLAEMYLVRAECNMELNSAIGNSPINDLIAIQTRSGVLNVFINLDLSVILNERQKELGFEGLRIHDLKRRKLSINSLPFTSPQLVLPIPQSEMESNSLMVQNTGY